jgi:hypothetical protein
MAVGSNDIIVDVCRADDSAALAVLVGASTQWWADRGYTVVAAQYATGGGGTVAINVRREPTGAPENLFGDLTDAFSAVLVLAGN